MVFGAMKNKTVGRVLNFRVFMLLKSAVIQVTTYTYNVDVFVLCDTEFPRVMGWGGWPKLNPQPAGQENVFVGPL